MLKRGQLNKCFPFLITGFNVLLFACILQPLVTLYFCTSANLKVLKLFSSFWALCPLPFKKEMLLLCWAVMFRGISAHLCTCLYSPAQRLQVVPGHQTYGSDGVHVLSCHSDAVFFPVLTSWLAFASRLEESVVQLVGMGFWEWLVWASLQEKVTYMWKDGAQADANKILPLRNVCFIYRSFSLFWTDLWELANENFELLLQNKTFLNRPFIPSKLFSSYNPAGSLV